MKENTKKILISENEYLLLKKENEAFKQELFGSPNYPVTWCNCNCGTIVSSIPFETHDGMCHKCSIAYMNE
jgi:hypothetical protein